MPSIGQNPKHFDLHGQGRRFFVTEQMLELWEDMRGDKMSTYRRVLSGPMGVGKSYLSYFLAARAYAEGWLVLYISDAGELDRKTEEESALQLVKRFLGINKDILTGAELEMLVNDYDGTYNISFNTLSVIFEPLLKSRERKTLLLVDEHGKLFEKEPYIPVKFKSLVSLSSYHWWGEDAKGSRVIFTGTAHAKYEMTILDDSYRPTSVVFVGPLSKGVFSKLVHTYPCLGAKGIEKEVAEITNCVPRELVQLATSMESLRYPISKTDLEKWITSRIRYFRSTAENYIKSCDRLSKEWFHNALLETFLGASSTVDFDWDFVDLGLIYRTKDVTQIGTQHHILCRPAQKALLELFKNLPLPENIRRRICDGDLSGDDFEMALYHQLICATKPIVLNATDLNGKNPTTVTLDFLHCATLAVGQISLGLAQDRYLTRGYKGYPRFDFMLGPMFIQASISDFGTQNKGSANLILAFERKGNKGKNQIEAYLDHLYSTIHSATIQNNKFVVTRNKAPLPEFRVVYIRGRPGKPTHRDLVKSFPDVLHVTFEELKAIPSVSKVFRESCVPASNTEPNMATRSYSN
ncbi:hypothetical protein BG000_011180 [Podila horticola]|nr:hypothetical protein BG000_011180 [Podila horticola]